MQSVSTEWNENQKADVRRPGFVVIETPDIVIYSVDILFENDSVSGYNIYSFEPKTPCESFVNESIVIPLDLTYAADETTINVDISYECDFKTRSYAVPDIRDSGNITLNISPGFGKLHSIVLAMPTTITIPESKGMCYVHGIPVGDISSYTHSRSFDPMGMELPTNDMSVDIFNSDGKYTDFYEQYNNEEYRINVSYGYKLATGDEVIPGGSFRITDVQLNDDIVTITGESLLSFIDEKVAIDIFDIKGTDGYIRVPISYEGITEDWEKNKDTLPSYANRNNYVYLYNNPQLTITVGELLSQFEASGVIVVSNVELSYSTDEIRFTLTGSEAVQCVANLTLYHCYVNREDVIEYEYVGNTTPNEGNHIRLLNCLDKPLYTSAKSVRKFEISVSNRETLYETYSKKYSEDADGAYATDAFPLDFYENRIRDISIDECHMIYADIYPDGVKIYSYYYKDNWKIASTYCPKGEYVDENVVSEKGIICDLSNPLGEPPVDKIAKYYSNRDIYTFNVRGNPARDVGDYVWVSLVDDVDETTYKKGLVLSSVLTFNGTFHEELEVRIINTEYEGTEVTE